MLKFLKSFIIFIVVVTAIIAITIYILLKTINLNDYRTKIIQKATETMGRVVRIGDLGFTFTFKDGLTLQAKDLSLEDFTTFSAEYLLSIEVIYLNVDFLPLLTKKQLKIKEIEIRQPVFNFIERNGNNNIDMLLKDIEKAKEIRESQKADAKTGDSKPSKSASKAKSSNQFAERLKLEMPEWTVSSIKIKNGQINLINSSNTDFDIIIPFEKIDFVINDFSLDTAFPFQIRSALFSNEHNLQLKGVAKIDQSKGQLGLGNLYFGADLKPVKVDLLNEKIPVISQIGLKDKLDGEFSVKVPEFTINKAGLFKFSLEADLNNGKFTISPLASPIENFDIRISMTEKDINIDEFFFYLASGKVSIKGQIEDYLKDKKFLFKMTMDEIKLAELLEKEKLPFEVKGSVFGQLDVYGIGFTKMNLDKSLFGEGQLYVKDGEIVNYNVLEKILKELSFIPGLTERLIKELPAEYKKPIEKLDTKLEKLIINIVLRDGKVFFDNDLSANQINLKSTGNMDFASNISMTPKLYIQKDLAEQIVKSVNEFKYLLDEKNQIYIPLIPYDGPIKDLKLLPDPVYIGKKISVSMGKEQLKDLINKTIGVEEDNNKNEGADSQQNNKNSSPETMIMENIDNIMDALDGILEK